jgi:hypothetical protein
LLQSAGVAFRYVYLSIYLSIYLYIYHFLYLPWFHQMFVYFLSSFSCFCLLELVTHFLLDFIDLLLHVLLKFLNHSYNHSFELKDWSFIPFTVHYVLFWVLLTLWGIILLCLSCFSCFYFWFAYQLLV